MASIYALRKKRNVDGKIYNIARFSNKPDFTHFQAPVKIRRKEREDEGMEEETAPPVQQYSSNFRMPNIIDPISKQLILEDAEKKNVYDVIPEAIQQDYALFIIENDEFKYIPSKHWFYFKPRVRRSGASSVEEAEKIMRNKPSDMDVMLKGRMKNAKIEEAEPLKETQAMKAEIVDEDAELKKMRRNMIKKDKAASAAAVNDDGIDFEERNSDDEDLFAHDNVHVGFADDEGGPADEPPTAGQEDEDEENKADLSSSGKMISKLLNAERYGLPPPPTTAANAKKQTAKERGEAAAAAREREATATARDREREREASGEEDEDAAAAAIAGSSSLRGLNLDNIKEEDISDDSGGDEDKKRSPGGAASASSSGSGAAAAAAEGKGKKRARKVDAAPATTAKRARSTKAATTAPTPSPTSSATTTATPSSSSITTTTTAPSSPPTTLYGAGATTEEALPLTEDSVKATIGQHERMKVTELVQLFMRGLAGLSKEQKDQRKAQLMGIVKKVAKLDPEKFVVLK